MRAPALSTREVHDDVRFVPAGWVVATVGIARFVLGRGRFGKLGIAALLWSMTPRRLKLIVGGALAAAVIVLVGALAAIVLLALELA